ncbi:hypothetical protein Pedsa_1287 [Pseudopedobacter saltans DSM 12145]|uniref:Uncharacterized protein n=1 Tax=Pseudopedobacter saltans (strain ATCC 51119 / DSM 12145 / JCM 21818 / CCUG 39354 / LMG 10337 / NBRC 100064 / NCIMB 13643) TaxID=762903 RepID=F0SDV8_PSESL|nr:hypothetical protein [Pseudopedobacter saltans]ADY51854.1 hypothetical protein Pedsa_1287 [Pseudopedobacter saltans DSM 12145]
MIRYTILFAILLFTNCRNRATTKTIFESDKIDTAVTGLHESRKFVLKKHLINADFNYKQLNNIDAHIKSAVVTKNLISIFEPEQGKYNYYQFIATFKGENLTFPGEEGDSVKTFHDILIIKANQNNTILDAYSYTLEWGEMPLQYDVLKSAAKGIQLEDGLDISKLKFKRTYNSLGYDTEMVNEEGTISFKL